MGCPWYVQYSSQLGVTLWKAARRRCRSVQKTIWRCVLYTWSSPLQSLPWESVFLNLLLSIMTSFTDASLSLPYQSRAAVLLCWEDQAGDLSSQYYTSGVQLALSALWSPGCHLSWLFDPVNDFTATWLYPWLCVKSYSNRRPRFFFSEEGKKVVTNICRMHATYLTYDHMEQDLGSCLRLAKQNIVSATSFYCSLSLQKFCWLFEKEIIPILWHVGVSRALQYACCLELDVTDRLPH